MSARLPLIYPKSSWQGPEILPGAWPARMVQPSDSWFCLGSCFAQRSAKALQQHLLPVHFGAGGALYTPEAILRWLKLCRLAATTPQENFYKQVENLIFASRSCPIENKPQSTSQRYLHPYTSGFMEAPSKAQLQKQLWQQCLLDSQYLNESAVMIITLGSSFSFYSPRQNCYWSNGHRLPTNGPNAVLQKKLLSQSQIDQALSAIHTLLREWQPQTQVVYSVSPIRHSPLPALDNSLSKAQLLSASHRLRSQGQIYYFPAYEIMLDELRDYRWYDYQHKQLRIDSFALLLERLLDVAASEELRQFLGQVVVLAQLLRHRKHSKDNAQANIQQQDQAEALLEKLRQQYPALVATLPENADGYHQLLAQSRLENYTY